MMMSGEGITRQVANYLVELKFEDLSEEIIAKAKTLILDAVGCSLAGHPLKSAQVMMDVMASQSGSGEVPVMGSRLRLTAACAGAVNGFQTYATMNDDSYMGRGWHPGHSIIPTALAIGQERSHSGREVITAVAGAYDVSCRIAKAQAPSNVGHPTFFGWKGAVNDVFGSVTAAGKLLNLSSDQMCSALGLAGNSASGTRGTTYTLTGWPWDAGKGVWLGILCALLAERGIDMGDTILEGREELLGTLGKGFLRLYSAGTTYIPGIPDFGAVTRDLGTSNEIMKVTVKGRASPTPTQAMLEAGLNITKQHGIVPSDIRHILVKGQKVLGVQHAATMAGSKKERTYERLCTNYPFLLGVTLVSGKSIVTVTDNIEYTDNPLVWDVAAKTEFQLHPEFEALYSREMPATVLIETNGGEKYEETVMYGKGDYRNPMSDEELLYKFKSNAVRSVSEAQAERLFAAISQLERVDKISDVVELLVA